MANSQKYTGRKEVLDHLALFNVSLEDCFNYAEGSYYCNFCGYEHEPKQHDPRNELKTHLSKCVKLRDLKSKNKNIRQRLGLKESNQPLSTTTIQNPISNQSLSNTFSNLANGSPGATEPFIEVMGKILSLNGSKVTVEESKIVLFILF